MCFWLNKILAHPLKHQIMMCDYGHPGANSDGYRNMDKLDLKIITQLQLDGRATNAMVARSTKASEETVRRRRFRLIEQGYMHVIAVPAARRLGYRTEVIIGIRSDVERLDEVADALADLDEVTWVSISTGSFDILARVIVRTTEGLHELMLNQIYQIQGIRSVETFMVLENVKEEYGLTSTALADPPEQPDSLQSDS